MSQASSSVSMCSKPWICSLTLTPRTLGTCVLIALIIVLSVLGHRQRRRRATSFEVMPRQVDAPPVSNQTHNTDKRGCMEPGALERGQPPCPPRGDENKNNPGRVAPPPGPSRTPSITKGEEVSVHNPKIFIFPNRRPLIDWGRKTITGGGR